MEIMRGDEFYSDHNEKTLKNDLMLKSETACAESIIGVKKLSEFNEMDKTKCLKYLRLIKNIIPSWAEYKNAYEIHFNAIMNAKNTGQLENYLLTFSGKSFEKFKKLTQNEFFSVEDNLYYIDTTVETLCQIQSLIMNSNYFESHIDRVQLKSLVIQDFNNRANSDIYYNPRLFEKWDAKSVEKASKTEKELNGLISNKELNLNTYLSPIKSNPQLELPLVTFPPLINSFNHLDNDKNNKDLPTSKFDNFDKHSQDSTNFNSTYLNSSIEYHCQQQKTSISQKDSNLQNVKNDNVVQNIQASDNISQLNNKYTFNENKNIITTQSDVDRTEFSTLKNPSEIINLCSPDINSIKIPQESQGILRKKDESSTGISPINNGRSKSMMEKLLLEIPHEFSTQNEISTFSTSEKSLTEHQTQEVEKAKENAIKISSCTSHIADEINNNQITQRSGEMPETQVCTMRVGTVCSPICSEDNENEIHTLGYECN